MDNVVIYSFTLLVVPLCMIHSPTLVDSLERCGEGPHTLGDIAIDVYQDAGQPISFSTNTSHHFNPLWQVRFSMTSLKKQKTTFQKHSRNEKQQLIIAEMSSILDGIKLWYTVYPYRVRFDSAKATLHLWKAPILKHSDPILLSVYEGDVTKGPCFQLSGSPQPDFKLLVGETEVERNRYQYTSGCLKIGPVQKSDNTSFTVVARNCLSPGASLHFKIQVKTSVKPMIFLLSVSHKKKPTPTSLEWQTKSMTFIVTQGTDFTLHYAVSGVPTPLLTCYHQNSIIQLSSRASCNMDTFFLKIVSHEDVGLYQITARNFVGHAQIQFTIQVQDTRSDNVVSTDINTHESKTDTILAPNHTDSPATQHQNTTFSGWPVSLFISIIVVVVAIGLVLLLGCCHKTRSRSRAPDTIQVESPTPDTNDVPNVTQALRESKVVDNIYDDPVDEWFQNRSMIDEKYDNIDILKEIEYSNEYELGITSNDIISQSSCQDDDNMMSCTDSGTEAEMQELYYNSQAAILQTPPSPMYEIPITT